MKHSLSRTTGLDFQGQGAQISQKKVTGSDTVYNWPPNPCIMPIGHTSSNIDFGLKFLTTSRKMVSHTLKSYGQIGISIASWECSTILLGKLVLNCVIVIEPVEFMSHDLKLILYCVSGQTSPRAEKRLIFKRTLKSCCDQSQHNKE